MTGPYRTAALEIVPSHRERAYCPHCLYSRGLSGNLLRCKSPAVADPSGKNTYTEYVNHGGYCDGYAPSRWTRLLRWLGWGRPTVLISTEKPKPKPTSPSLRVGPMARARLAKEAASAYREGHAAKVGGIKL